MAVRATLGRSIARVSSEDSRVNRGISLALVDGEVWPLTRQAVTPQVMWSHVRSYT